MVPCPSEVSWPHCQIGSLLWPTSCRHLLQGRRCVVTFFHNMCCLFGSLLAVFETLCGRFLLQHVLSFPSEVSWLHFQIGSLPRPTLCCHLLCGRLCVVTSFEADFMSSPSLRPTSCRHLLHGRGHVVTFSTADVTSSPSLRNMCCLSGSFLWQLPLATSAGQGLLPSLGPGPVNPHLLDVNPQLIGLDFKVLI